MEKVNSKNVTGKSKWEQNKCPFCYEALELMEILKRKAGRKCKCKKCNKIIDERFVIW